MTYSTTPRTNIIPTAGAGLAGPGGQRAAAGSALRLSASTSPSARSGKPTAAGRSGGIRIAIPSASPADEALKNLPALPPQHPVPVDMVAPLDALRQPLRVRVLHSVLCTRVRMHVSEASTIARRPWDSRKNFTHSSDSVHGQRSYCKSAVGMATHTLRAAAGLPHSTPPKQAPMRRAVRR